MKLALSRRLAMAGTVALTAAAVALSGTPAQAAPATAKSGQTSAAAVSVKVSVGDALLTRGGTTARVKISSTARLTGARADLYVGGKFRQSITLAYQDGPATFAPRAGYGSAQLRNVTVTYVDANGAPGQQTVSSNTFLVRRAIDSAAKVKMRKRGSSIRVSGSAWRAAQPNGSWKRVSQVVLQKKVGSKWKTVKKVRPNSKGKFSFSIRSSKRVKYRGYVKTTSTLKGGTTRTIKI